MNDVHVPLTNSERVAIIDAEDSELVLKYNWHLQRKYAAAWIPELGRTLRLHQLLLPTLDRIDHIDGDQLNCRRINLREATHTQNMQNRKVSCLNKSGFKGVYWHKGDARWHAQIHANGRRYRLGAFNTAEAAAYAYDRAAQELHGSFARLNFP